ncbi:HTTM domain-containing protein [Myxococcota bacterium]|jgi:hypothetical protein|nr:HTTM domain-containing protein [Myxococcota bacterium]
MIGRLWRYWVALWDHKEPATAMGLVRLLLGLVLCWDLAEAWQLDLVSTLWAPPEAGGFPSNLLNRDPVPEVYRLFPPTEATAAGLHAVTFFASLAWALGLFTRVSGLVLILAYAQLAQILPLGDRGIDLMMRDVMFILLFSRCGDALSLDARRRTGSFFGDGALVSAWPRHLIILQIVVMYWMAGVQKTALTWTPFGGYHALYIILQDPHIARHSFEWLASVWPLTSLATATTHIWENSAPLMLVLMHFRMTDGQPGRLRAWAKRLRLLHLWVFVGVLLHLGIAATMQLGIFPWAMLALYPAWFHPDELGAAWAWGKARLGR